MTTMKHCWGGRGPFSQERQIVIKIQRSKSFFTVGLYCVTIAALLPADRAMVANVGSMLLTYFPGLRLVQWWPVLKNPSECVSVYIGYT
jgi:hypothetical protein